MTDDVPQVGVDFAAQLAGAMASQAGSAAVSLDNSRIRSLIELHRSRVVMADIMEVALDPDGRSGMNVFALVTAYDTAMANARESIEQIERLERLLGGAGDE